LDYSFNKFQVSQKKQLIVKTKPKQFLFLIVAALLLYLIVLLLTSLPMFRSESTKMIGKVVNGEKYQIIAFSIDEIRVVDEDLAHLLGEKCVVAARLEVKWNLERFVFKGK
jgi:hypothetical protein